ncbi:MAG: multidrug effflux MFS transporter [Gammaproteobacteria bacterium]
MRTATPNLALITTILVLASAISIMSTDLYTPSLPHLPAYFGTSESAVQLTISLNLMAFSLGQLFLGPLSDRYGRRPVMLTGLGFFTLCGLLCAAAQSVGQLIVVRVLQGLSASVEAVVGLAIINDLFDESGRVRALALWGMAVALAPAVAPIIGGYVHVSLGWRANFVLLAVAGLAVCALVWRSLPESTVPDRDALHPLELLRGYGRLLCNTAFLGYTLILGAGLGAIFAFITDGPFILIAGFGIATEHFGYYQAVIVAAFFLGSLATVRVAGRLNPLLLLHAGLGVSLCAAVLLAALHVHSGHSAYSLTGAVALFAFGLGPVFAVAPMLALGAAGGRAGTAAALLGAIETGTSGAASGAVSILHDGSAGPLVWVICALTVLALAALLVTRRSRRRER